MSGSKLRSCCLMACVLIWFDELVTCAVSVSLCSNRGLAGGMSQSAKLASLADLGTQIWHDVLRYRLPLSTTIV